MRLDFRTKLLMTLTITTLMLNGQFSSAAGYYRLALGFTPFVFLLINGRFKAFIKGALAFASAFAAGSIGLRSTAGFWNFLLLAWSGIGGRLLPGLMMGYYTVATTTMDDLSEALRRGKCPDSLIIPLTTMQRFFYSVHDDYAQIKDAITLRGLNRIQLFKTPVLFLEYRFVPLLMCSVQAADDVSISAMTRGLVPGEARSTLSQTRLRAADWLIIGLLLICWLAFIRGSL